MELQGPFSDLQFSSRQWLVLGLAVLTVLNAMAVIYISSERRSCYARLAELARQRENLSVEWSQLLLERGTLQSEERVERLAREKLGMLSPLTKQVIVP